ncbi:SPOR domain-containing protein [Paenibacillus sp. JJ-223]|uniref:SPOR domain-containing protein n=1 Tax=Paenibacillus sp. JJ-223 TaxID=2905647 RepID=UPI001F25A0AB|nr:SPOR domain-containing protein [Paenibacillus sp. JJ-223]CAH1201054.1 hypothetical protein PAECIP111890_01751 [Paenibacillus sp. JJ-223]
MNNARMTFRFGEHDAVKPQNEGRLAPATLQAANEEITHAPASIDSAPQWSAEEIPGDWGETLPILTEGLKPGKGMDKHASEREYPQAGYANERRDLPEASEAVDPWNEEYADHNWVSEHNHYSYQRNRAPRGWKMIGSVTGAIVTGALFGLVILSFFNKDGAAPNVVPQKNTANVSVSAGQQAQATLAGGNYYALQYGVFSSPERAEQAKLELTQAGIAAEADPEDGNRVYAGISPDREEAKLLSTRLKAQGVELYVKEIPYPEVGVAALGVNQATATQFFNDSETLIGLLSTLSIGELGKAAPQAASAETMTSIQNRHESWLRGFNDLSANTNGEAAPYAAAMAKAMNSAITAVAEFNKKPSAAHMWSVQTNLMDYVLQQKKWLDTLQEQ